MQVTNPKLNSVVKVYVATFNSDVVVGEVEPVIRNEWIQRCTDPNTKRQRYCVWRLLDYALQENYGKGVDNFHITVNGGKWNSTDGVRFSLSHCRNIVAVAVCLDEVGLDLEEVSSFAERVHNASFLGRILTENEQNLVKSVPNDCKEQILAEMWTKKESYYKLSGDTTFVPAHIDTTKIAPHCDILSINGEKYALSVATKTDVESNLTIELQQVKIKW